MKLEPVAVLRSVFEEKFGAPRQSGLVPEAVGRVEFLPGFGAMESVAGLEGFSHLWLVTGFHLSDPWKKGRSTVRPPRLGGNKRVGVWASRSPNRPNGLGLSLVKLERVDAGIVGAILHVSGLDAVDGTPVYDVKPYLPYAEALPEARADWTPPPEATLTVIMAPDAGGVEIQDLVKNALSQRPWPAYQEAGRGYRFRLAGHEVAFVRTSPDEVVVTSIMRSDKIDLRGT